MSMNFSFDQMHGIVLQLRSGRTIGYREIVRKYSLLKILFVDRMKPIITSWVDMFWPYDTGYYHDTVIRDMEIEWEKINISALGVYYAPYVELMAGVIWTNAMTIQQPMERLREFIIIEMIQIIKDLKQETGL